MSEKLAIDAEDASEFAYCSGGLEKNGWPFSWEEVSDEIVDQSRWHTWHRKVIKRTVDGSFWSFKYGLGSTEMQDDREFPAEMTRVWPHMVVVTEYREFPPGVQS